MKLEEVARALARGFWARSLPEPQRTKYFLIQRYRDKVSKRLLDEQEAMLGQGKLSWEEEILNAMMRPNPFLKLLPKGQEIQGGYVTVPIQYGQS